MKCHPSVNHCSICGIPIFGSFIGTGDGTMKDGGSFAHPDCYHRARADAAESRLAALREAIEGMRDSLEAAGALAAEECKPVVASHRESEVETCDAILALPQWTAPAAPPSTNTTAQEEKE